MGEGQCEREERETAEAQPIPLRKAWTRLMTEIATRIPNHLKSTQFYEAINDVEGGVRVAERRSDAARPVERYAPDQIEGVTMDRDKWRTRAIALEGEIAKLRTAEADRRESAPIPEDHRMKVAHKDEELPNACPARFGDLKCIFVAGHSHYHMGGSETWNDGEVAPAPGLAELPSFGACPESEDLPSSCADLTTFALWIADRVRLGEFCDHACERCIPGGTMVQEGFVCVPHQAHDIKAAALLSGLAPKEEP